MKKERARPFEDIFQDCLEGLLGEQETLESILSRHPDQAEELRSRLEMVLLLHQVKPAFDPRPGFIAASKGRLMERIAEGAPSARASPWYLSFFAYLQKILAFGNNPRLAFSILAVAVFTVAVFTYSGVTITRAASLAIPGDFIYPAKLTLEDIRLAVTPGLANRAEFNIHLASVRLIELQNLVLENRFEYVSITVERYQRKSQAALDALSRLERSNPKRARELAIVYQRTLQNHQLSMSVLTNSLPVSMQPMMTDSLVSVRDTLTAVVQIITIADAQIASTATQSSEPGAVNQPTQIIDVVSFTKTPTLLEAISWTKTATGTITLTITPKFTLRATRTPTATNTLVFTPTATATAPKKITSTPTATTTITATPTYTRRPTKTARPVRTKKPTKTPRVMP